MRLTRGETDWPLVLIIGLSLFVTVAAAAAGRFDAVTGVRPVTAADRPLDRAAWRNPGEIRFDGLWTAGAEGLSIRGGDSASVALPVSVGRDGRLSLFVHGRSASGFHHTIEVSENGRQYREVLRDVSLDGLRIDLTRSAGHLESFWMKVSISGAGADRAAHFSLSRIKLVEVKPPLAIPNPFVALIAFLTPVIAYHIRRSLVGTGALGFAVGVLVGMAGLAELSGWLKSANPLRWWELVVDGQGRDAYFFIPFAVLLARWAWLAGLTDGPAFRLHRWSAWALGGLLLWGASLRLGALLEVGWGPLNPDAITYMKLAELMTSPYDTGLREPMWIWMIWGWFKLVGASPLSLRCLTFVLSLAVIVAGFAFASRYTGKPVIGLLVAASLAMNPFMVALSARGLREEAYLLAVLALAGLLLTPQPRLPARRAAIGLALAGGVAQLLRFNSYTILAPLLIWWVWRNPKERLALAAIPVLFIAAVSVPHLQHNARQFGDPLYSVNAHFMWSRNYEFVVLKETGCAGCPSREEFETNSVSGTNIGAFEYVFGMHTLGEVARYTGEGYAKMYFAPTDLFEIQSGTQSRWLFLAYLVGLGVALFSSQREIFVMILILANGVPFAMSLGIDARLGIQTAPFVALILSAGIYWLAGQAWRYGGEAMRRLESESWGFKRVRVPIGG